MSYAKTRRRLAKIQRASAQRNKWLKIPIYIYDVVRFKLPITEDELRNLSFPFDGSVDVTEGSER